VCRFQWIPSTLLTCLVISKTKAGLLSLCIESGMPYLGMISFSRAHVTSDTFSVLVGYALTQLEKVSIKTSRYLKSPGA
jgi:hypothetical protein